MIEFLALLLGFFLISLLIIIILIGLKFLYNLATIGQSNNAYNEESDKQLGENSREDSQADLYMSEVYPDDNSLMFPEEFDD